MNHTDLNINDVIQGRETASKDVYACYWKRLVYYCIQRNSKLLREEAEDIVSLAMIKVYEFRHRLESTKHLNNVLYQSVGQRALDYYRDRKHAAQRERIYSMTEDEFLDPNEELIDLSRVITEIMAYIATLPQKYQEVAKRVIEEYGTRQPEHHNTFYVHLFRLRSKLNRKFHIS